jgi:hypothetical protein
MRETKPDQLRPDPPHSQDKGWPAQCTLSPADHRTAVTAARPRTAWTKRPTTPGRQRVRACTDQVWAGSPFAKICVNNNCEIVLRPLGRRPVMAGPGAASCANFGTSPIVFRLLLDSKLHKAGISTAAPRDLAAPSQSLPAILHMRNLEPLSRYSQGSWGLSVQVWGIGIFTNTAISSSLWRRQRPSRYTIRAGRHRVVDPKVLLITSRP